MKKNRRMRGHIISALCIVTAILIFCLSRSTLFNPGRMYDDDSLLIREQERYSSTQTRGSTVGEDGEIEMTAVNFSGIRTMHIFTISEGETLSYSWDTDVSSGRFKVVLIDTKSAEIIETLFEGSGTGSVDDYPLPPEEYRVKYVGDRAKFHSRLQLLGGSESATESM